MKTKNAKAISRKESEHLAAVKQLCCSVCEEPGPCDAHHIKQGQHFTVVALCKSCHQGPMLGLHGNKGIWRIKKMDEIDALAVTYENLLSVQWGIETKQKLKG